MQSAKSAWWNGNHLRQTTTTTSSAKTFKNCNLIAAAANRPWNVAAAAEFTISIDGYRLTDKEHHHHRPTDRSIAHQTFEIVCTISHTQPKKNTPMRCAVPAATHARTHNRASRNENALTFFGLMQLAEEIALAPMCADVAPMSERAHTLEMGGRCCGRRAPQPMMCGNIILWPCSTWRGRRRRRWSTQHTRQMCDMCWKIWETIN